MAFDITTAKPASGFDIESAKPVDMFDPATQSQQEVSGLTGSQQPKADGMAENTLDVLGEIAAASNRSVTEFIDFVGPDTVNAVLRLAGSEKQMPTLTGALGGTGIQGGFMEPGMARDAASGFGTAIPVAGGLKTVSRAPTAMNALADFVGIGSTKTAPAIGHKVYTSLDDATPKRIKPSKKGLIKAERKGSLLSERGDKVAAGYRLNEAGEVVKDAAQKKAIKQGFDDGFVAMINDAPPEAKKKMLKMVETVEAGKKNFRSQGLNRPHDIAGDSMLERIKVVKAANKGAGKKLDAVANDLKGKRVDTKPAVDTFISELDRMGVKFDPSNRTLDFSKSDIRGLAGPENFLKRLINRMYDDGPFDAYQTHQMKRFIDEQVTYGKNAEGLAGKTERIAKQLRHDIDAILDANFPEYNTVNTQYAETIQALDAIQDVAGKKMDLFGPNANKALGTLSRRVLGHAQSRIPLIDSLNSLDEIAMKYASPGSKQIVPYDTIVRNSGVKHLDDDFIAQVMFIDELEKIFGTHARASLQGDVGKSVAHGIKAASSNRGIGDAAIDAVGSGVNKVRGINEDNAIIAIKDMLRTGK